MNVKFIIDITQKITEPLKKTQGDIKRITDQIKQNNSVVIEANKNLAAASIRRRQYMKEEMQDLKELRQRRKSAYSVEDIAEYNRRIAETTQRIQTLRSADKGMFSGLTSRIGLMAAGAFSLYQGFNFVKSSIGAYDSEEKANAQVKASLASTGGVSGKTFSELSAEASRLQGKTLFGDEAIKGAQSVLLTFKQVRGEIFDKATPAILDLATKLKTDLNSATVQVGKTLEDPIRGMLNLRRSGVQFSDEQEANIKKLVESGKLQEAQMIILNELQMQFGGSAEAAAKAGLGPWQQLSNIWGDQKEKIGGIVLSIGKSLLPTIRGLVQGIGSLLDFMKRNSEAFKTVAKIVAVAGVALGTYMLWVKLLPARLAILAASKTIYGLVTGAMTIKVVAANIAMKALNLTMLMSPWGLAIAGIASVVAGIVLLTKKTSYLSETQKKVSELRATANDKIAEEKTRVTMLTSAINDSNLSMTIRKGKLEELQSISEEYFGQLKIGKDGVEGLTKATNEYINAFQRKVYEEAIAEEKAKNIKEVIKQQMLIAQGNKKEVINSKLGIEIDRADIIKKLEKEGKGIAIVAANFMKKFGFSNDALVSSDLNFNPINESKTVENNIKGGEGIKNINITIGKLVETISLTTETMEQGAEDFAAKVREVLLNAVNDANYMPG